MLTRNQPLRLKHIPKVLILFLTQILTCNLFLSMLFINSFNSLLQVKAQKLAFELYDAQDSEFGQDMGDELNMTDKSELDDDDKLLYNIIGKSEIQLEKIFTNLLTNDVLSII